MGKYDENARKFAERYFRLNITINNNPKLYQVCFRFIEKDYLPAVKYAELQIVNNATNMYTVNSALNYLSDDNEIKKKFAFEEFKKLDISNKYLRKYPDRKSLIFNTIIEDIELRERVVFNELTIKYKIFPNHKSIKKYDSTINERRLINSCLLVFKEKPWKVKFFSLKILNYWKEEILLKSKGQTYHFHIIEALKNKEIEKYAIKISEKILKEDTLFISNSLKNNNEKAYFVSWRLDEAILNLIRKEIVYQKNNKNNSKKILKILKNAYLVRKEKYILIPEFATLNFAFILNILSFFMAMHKDYKNACKYQNIAIKLLEKVTIDNVEEKIELYNKELISYIHKETP